MWHLWSDDIVACHISCLFRVCLFPRLVSKALGRLGFPSLLLGVLDLLIVALFLKPGVLLVFGRLDMLIVSIVCLALGTLAIFLNI